MTHTKILFLLIGLTATCLCGCTNNSPQQITLGTFNLEWLGDGSPDDRKIRTHTDIALLAEVLRDTNADILAVQEIENPQALERLLDILPEYKMARYQLTLGTSGGKQHIGFLYRSLLQVEVMGEVSALAVETGRTRAGLLVRCSVAGYHWLMLVVHLKSTSRADSTTALENQSRELRRLQAAQIRAWTDSVLHKTEEQHIIVLGDFNDSPRKKYSTLDTLKNASRLTFLTNDLTSCTYSALPSIDHLICSDSVLSHVVKGTLRTVNFRAMLPEAVAKRVSDHCPVVVQISL